MKKIIAILLASLMCFALAACGGNADVTEAVTTDETVDTAADVTADVTADETVFETAVETATDATDGTAAETSGETSANETEATDAAIGGTTIEEAIANTAALLDMLKNSDAEALLALGGTSTEGMDEMTVQMLNAMFSKIEYSFGAPVIHDDCTATVKAEITSIDINGVLINYMNELYAHANDEEEWDPDGSYFIQMICADDAATATTTVTVNYDETDDGWVFSSDNEEFISALYGGMR
ncbi:MAG: hypothetical protein IJ002_07195 [Clostridia bacterium]|nr:hypothetical protein [Clostridia bacterium]